MTAPGHLARLTTATDIIKAGECAPPFRSIVMSTLTCIDWMMGAKGRNGLVARINEAGRSPARQLERWKQGRHLLPDGTWAIVNKAEVVTSVLPHEAPHCIVDSDGDPASFAVDIWLLHETTGVLLHDKHPAWAMVPAAAYLVAGTEIRVGAHWDSPRDWPHIEFVGWRALCEGGVLKGGVQ